MNEFIGHHRLKYKSEVIFERRRRILRETRKLIAQRGYAGFSVRELCERASIAQKTLYNAFDNKENVIAAAIREYMAEFNDRTIYRFDVQTLDGRLERLIKVHSRNIQIKPYTSAIMAVYNAPGADRAVRGAIKNVADVGLRPFAEALETSKALAVGATASSLIHLLTTSTYAVLTDWCLGEIPDVDLVDRVSEIFLLIVVGATKGQVRADARRWLQDVRGQRASWIALRKLAEAPRAKSMEVVRERLGGQRSPETAEAPDPAGRVRSVA